MIYFLAAIPLFLVTVWAMRRLLGVRRLSATRTVVAALLGVLVGDLIGRLLESRGLDRDLAVLIGIVLGLMTSMLIVLLMAAIIRSPRRSRHRNPVSAVRRKVAQTQRSAEIARIASRHGLGRDFGVLLNGELTDEAAADYGESLRAALEEAGGVFVKLGQVLAGRADLLPSPIAERLRALHQDVEPAPKEAMQPAIEAALGRSVDSTFASFDWQPLGSASIGQVYEATLLSGERVVVKARRPGIKDDIERDLELIADLVAAAEEASDEARDLGIASVAEQFIRDLRAELDYRVEAKNTTEAGSFEGMGAISLPAIYAGLSSETVLVQDHIAGTPIGRLATPPADGRRLADSLFEYELQAILDGHRFHADPHPGNVMLTSAGGLALVDFGSAGKLSIYERASVQDIFVALALNDPMLLRSAALQMGMGSGAGVDVGQLDRAFARLMADHLSEGTQPSSDLLNDFVAIITKFGLQTPPEISQMLRALVTLQASLELLSPDYPVVDKARAFAETDLGNQLNADNLMNEARLELVRLAPILRRVPHQLDRIASQVENGELAVKVSLFDDASDVSVISTLVNRVVLALAGTALGVVSVMMFQIPNGPALTDNITLFDLLAYVGLFAGATLIMRVVLEVLSER